MPYVYLLSDYEECGANNVLATLDRTTLISLLDINWPRSDPAFPTDWLDTPDRRARWAEDLDDEEKRRIKLAKLLEKTDEELAADEDGWELDRGWGGVQLHVVLLR